MKIQVGDTVTRWITDGKGRWQPLMDVVVDRVQDGVIYAGPWTFDATWGTEIDEDLGWGPGYGVTGTIIRLKGEDPNEGPKPDTADNGEAGEGVAEQP